jgi:hypothetical protein
MRNILHNTKTEGSTMEMYLTGMSEELADKWKEGAAQVGLTDELNDLLKIYKEKYTEAKDDLDSTMGYLVNVMKVFVGAYENKIEVENKLYLLAKKMGIEEEEGGDE